MGLVFSSFDNWGKYLESLICRCARIIKEKGYKTFGIYDGGNNNISDVLCHTSKFFAVVIVLSISVS